MSSDKVSRVPKYAVRRLRAAKAAQDKIVVQLLSEPEKSTHEGPLRWGQFIDAEAHKNPQFGIFGTASAAAILLRAEGRETEYARTISSLPGWSGSGKDALDAKDLPLVLKCVAIAEAEPGCGNPGANQAELEETIAKSYVRNQAWGYYKGDDFTETEHRILPTAQVLAAVASSKSFRSKHSAVYRNGLNWLRSHLSAEVDRPALPRAFGLIALARNREQVELGSQAKHDATISALAEMLLSEFGRDRPLELVEYYEHVHYRAPDPDFPQISEELIEQSAPPPPTHLNRYMFYPIDIIVALALLESGHHRGRGRRYVLGVVKKLIEMVTAHRTYRSAATRRCATVDAYWAHRLLHEYRRVVSDDPGWVMGFWRRILFSIWLQWTAAGLIGTAAAVFGALFYLGDEQGRPMMGALGAIFGVVFAAVGINGIRRFRA